MPPNLTVDAAKYLDAREASDQFTPLPLSHYVFQTEQTRQHHDKNHPESTQHYRDLPSPPSLSIGIISAYNNTGHRLAARSTWLTTNPGSLATVHKFFIAEPEGGIGQLPQRVLWEAVLYDDIIILPFTDSYSKTPIKSVALYNWGVTVCGAWYVLRANDDVYLDLRGVMETAYSVVPSRVMAGLVIDGSSMRIPRPEHHGLSGRSGQKELLEKHRAWTFLREDWPCDRVPTFVQGNAVLLSQDLAFAVGKLKDEPWRRLEFVADDVLIGLIVDERVGGNRVEVVVNTAYAHEGKFVECREEYDWFFNIHPEYTYYLHENIVAGRGKCEGIDEVMCCGIQG